MDGGRGDKREVEGRNWVEGKEGKLWLGGRSKQFSRSSSLNGNAYQKFLNSH